SGPSTPSNSGTGRSVRRTTAASSQLSKPPRSPSTAESATICGATPAERRTFSSVRRNSREGPRPRSTRLCSSSITTTDSILSRWALPRASPANFLVGQHRQVELPLQQCRHVVAVLAGGPDRLQPQRAVGGCELAVLFVDQRPGGQQEYRSA